MGKKDVSEIAASFDGEVERFSNLATGQASVPDAALMMALLAETAAALAPDAADLLDIGCGAGNQTLNLLRVMPDLHCTLLDISGKMLERAERRVRDAGGKITAVINHDLRTAPLPESGYDLAVAAAVLHHLRGAADWAAAAERMHRILKPGGMLLVSDLIIHENPAVQRIMRSRYEKFLRSHLGDAEAERIMRSIAESDTPASVPMQTECLKKAGFREIIPLHLSGCFAAYAAVK